MTLGYYLLCGIPWTLYAVVTLYVKNRFLTFPALRFLLCFVLNLIFWPAAPLLAAWNKLIAY